MRITVREEEFELLPDRCLYWPSQELLVVADVHLGKAETFQQQGLWLPTGSSVKDLSTLSEVIAGRSVRQLIFLGDLVHSMAGVTREVLEDFALWLRNFDGKVRVVVGNHDAGLAKRWPAAWERATLCGHVRLGEFVFQHQPITDLESEGEFYWVGHVHPMIRLRKGPDCLRLPGFVISELQGLLPAFSTLSGGYDVPLSSDDHVFVAGDGQVYKI